jgi:hypothetical protein
MRVARNKVAETDVSATPSLPSALTAELADGTATNVLSVALADGAVHDAVSVSVKFDDETGNKMPGILWGYSSDLSAWVPGRRMMFGDTVEILADTTETISGRFQIYLDSSISHVFFMPDFDNLAGTTGAATKCKYVMALDEHREHF